MLDDLIIYQKTYDFILWLHPVVNKFPKSQRFVLGQRIENKTLDFIHSMIVANAARQVRYLEASERRIGRTADINTALKRFAFREHQAVWNRGGENE